MILKTNCLRAFFKTFFYFALLITIFKGFISYAEGKEISLAEILLIAFLGSTFLGLAATVMFTPHEIIWTKDSFSIKANFFGSGEFSWKDLEAYSSFGKNYGTFLIKFKGQQAFQMVPFGFLSAEWKEFHAMLRNRFPEKKTGFWIGPIPIHFGKK